MAEKIHDSFPLQPIKKFKKVLARNGFTKREMARKREIRCGEE